MTATDDFIYMRERRLPYKTFDADNHMYENRDAMTKHVPREYEGIIKYVEVNGRTKFAWPCSTRLLTNWNSFTIGAPRSS